MRVNKCIQPSKMQDQAVCRHLKNVYHSPPHLSEETNSANFNENYEDYVDTQSIDKQSPTTL